MPYFKALLMIASVLGVVACGGGGGGEVPPTNAGGSSEEQGDSSDEQSVEGFFSRKVQPELGFCRTCHVPGGVGDVDKGRLFMLSNTASEDYENIKKAWINLGEAGGSSRILAKASNTDVELHSGGSPWPVDSEPYNAMKAVLSCWKNPENCPGEAGSDDEEGDAVDPQAELLGAQNAKHYWFEYCEDKESEARLPADPRTLLQPGVSDGKQVHFNFYWKSCTQYDTDDYPKTCGELWSRVAEGETMMKGHGKIGQNIFFGGNHADGLWTISSSDYNNLWKGWGLSERPDNFDRLVLERYGLSMDSVERNPYPLPEESPDETQGGSGQLPNALTQVRGDNGEWTGKLGFRCHVCHTGQVDEPGLGAIYGSGNNASDFDLFLDEVMANVERPIPGVVRALPFTFNKSRGTSNALQPQIISFLTPDDLGVSLLDQPINSLFFALNFYGNSANTGEINPPAWWNLAFKPSKFFNGLLAGDNLRSGMAFDYPIARPPFMWADIEGAKKWAKANSMNPELWFMSLESPEYPAIIEENLAKQGAILFHTKNLWGSGVNDHIPRPEGNGSCAGCHGVYSDRYANDTDYLSSPELKGTAGYIVPLEIVGTDERYADSFTQQQTDVMSQYVFTAYNDSYKKEIDCTIQIREDLSDRKKGYLAPPLHGVWATAPYLHNGSIPDMWSLLDPDSRPKIWVRKSAPKSPGLSEKIVMGFDTNFQRAYDQEKMGWKYDVVSCEGGLLGGLLFPDCNEDGPTLSQQLDIVAAENSGLLYNFTTAPSAFMSKAKIEERKIFNTWEYARSNKGHDFTRSLSDGERAAIIEYLKEL